MRTSAHWRVAKVAKEIAAEAYERLAHDNAFHRQHPDAKRFVAMNWNKFIPDARKALAMALRSPKLSEERKDEIMEALQADSLMIGPSDAKTIRPSSLILPPDFVKKAAGDWHEKTKGNA